ncbi:MAG: peptidase dimerization domain-containing protein [Actinophytocola sp.]|nr:peptidase dimerization domain-containing protein [Actinophytocola sp.]
MGLLDADAAIVAEPTGCLPSLAQLGNAWAEIRIVGRAAHAGHPEHGTDAFHAALDYIAHIEQLLQDHKQDPDFPGHPRLNVGHFAMPGHPGTVPGECVLRCDVRVLPGVEPSYGLPDWSPGSARNRRATSCSSGRFFRAFSVSA